MPVYTKKLLTLSALLCAKDAMIGPWVTGLTATRRAGKFVTALLVDGGQASSPVEGRLEQIALH